MALAVATAVAQEAGELLQRDRNRSGGPRGASSHADADDEAEALIRAELTAQFPDWGYLGEETGRRPAAPGCPYLWLVDPNDGTASYLRGWRGSAVSIGLLCQGVPVLGVVLAYSAPDDAGDLISWAQDCGPVHRNGTPHVRSPFAAALQPHTLVGLSQDADAIAQQNAQLIAPARYFAVPSVAYRLALVAVGDAQGGVSLGHPTNWDLAGAHALVRGAGGEVVGADGLPIRYGPDGHVIGDTRVVVGAGPALASLLALRPWHTLQFARRQPDPLDLVALQPGKVVADAAMLGRAHGCLLGQVAGDSLGSLVEFKTSATIVAQYPGGPALLADGGTFNTLAGQPTDDSELALALARSLVCDPRANVEAAACAYRAWFQSRPFDIGGTISMAFGAIGAEDVAVGTAALACRSHASTTSQANGALMRVAPLGLWGALRPEAETMARARADAALSHPHAVCQDASALWAALIAKAVREGPSPQALYHHALQLAESMQPSLLQRVQLAAAAPPAEFQQQMGWVLTALQNALFHLANATPFADAVRQTVAQGGDTDTNAAIAGALLGAVYGRDAVPLQWRQMVLSCRPLPGSGQPRPRWLWPVDALMLAERLVLAGQPAG
ncbi:MAG: ADP-ribosylation/Crystallin J1 [Myxococcales bacterium]|nr:ADP-ribosylation/Crystallin J1 [Myxococcales bacterium]